MDALLVTRPWSSHGRGESEQGSEHESRRVQDGATAAALARTGGARGRGAGAGGERIDEAIHSLTAALSGLGEDASAPTRRDE